MCFIDLFNLKNCPICKTEISFIFDENVCSCNKFLTILGSSQNKIPMLLDKAVYYFEDIKIIIFPNYKPELLIKRNGKELFSSLDAELIGGLNFNDGEELFKQIKTLLAFS